MWVATMKNNRGQLVSAPSVPSLTDLDRAHAIRQLQASVPQY